MLQNWEREQILQLCPEFRSMYQYTFQLPHVRKQTLLTLTKFDPSLGRQSSSKNNARRTLHQRYCTLSTTPLRNILETRRRGKNFHQVLASKHSKESFSVYAVTLPKMMGKKSEENHSPTFHQFVIDFGTDEMPQTK